MQDAGIDLHHILKTSDEEDGLDKESSSIVHTDKHVERLATAKMDLVVVPIVGMYFLLSFLDRSNIGNARIAGLEKDLKMTDHQYFTALTVTYVPYIVAELPMNLLMKRLGANITLPLMVTLWGMVCACQGAVSSYKGLLACRFFLGALEGGLFPGIVLYLSSFYKRHAMQLRCAIMFSVTSLAGAFSGLLAAAIQNMDGLRGHSGWQWIFILEGVFTTVFGLLSFLVFPASPSTARFLTPQEREVYTQALANDWSGDDGKEKFSWSEVWSALCAPQALLLCLPLFASGLTLFGLANFTPTIVNALGQSPTRTQLLSVPPYACSFAFSITASWFSDKYKQRGTMAIITSLIAIVGYAMFLGSSSKHTDYGALFLQIIGAYSVPPALSTWQSNNLQPHYRRATAVAMGFMSSNIGAIVSTWIFVDPPRFRTASIIDLSFSCVMAVSSAAAMVYFRMRNTAKRAEVVRLIGEKGVGTEPGGWDSKEERVRLGDRHPRFEYTL